MVGHAIFKNYQIRSKLAGGGQYPGTCLLFQGWLVRVLALLKVHVRGLHGCPHALCNPWGVVITLWDRSAHSYGRIVGVRGLFWVFPEDVRIPTCSKSFRMPLSGANGLAYVFTSNIHPRLPF